MSTASSPGKEPNNPPAIVAFGPQVSRSQSEALVAQLKTPRYLDKSNQHISDCLFSDRRRFEPWPRKYLKYILMEKYIYLNESGRLPVTWDCPLGNCDKRNGTFGDIITHLDDCQGFNDNPRQYICPVCQGYVEIPAHTCPGCPEMSNRKKAVLRFKRSFENVLCSPRERPSSTGSSPVSHFQPDAVPTLKRYQTSSTLYWPADSIPATQASNSSSQHNKSVFLEPITTNFSPSMRHELYSHLPGTSSTVSNSSFENGSSGNLSLKELSSATSLSELDWSPANSAWADSSCPNVSNVSLYVGNTQPPSNMEHFGTFSSGPALPELPEDGLMPGMASIGFVVQASPMELHSNTMYSGAQNEYDGVFLTSQQDPGSQQHIFSSVTPDLPFFPPPGGPNAVLPSLDPSLDPSPDQELSSPTSTDIAMEDTPPTSEGSHQEATSGPLLKCKACGWKPDMRVKRPLKKLQIAVEKHFKRNHQSQDYSCDVCSQSFRNRPDNVKPHIKRKHWDEFKRRYPEEVAAVQQLDGGMQGGKVTARRLVGRRKTVVPLPILQASPTRRKQTRFIIG